SLQFSLVVGRAAVADRGVQTLPVVETLDVLEDGEHGPLAAAVDAAVDELGLERAEKALGDGIVPAVRSPAHAADDAVSLQQLPIIGAGVLGTAVGVVDEARRWPAPRECSLQRVDADSAVKRVAGRPADHAGRA